jgi:pyruvate-formate lyase-activating enzyme
VFFSGCPLRYRWCQNPEANTALPELFFLAEKCTGYGSCRMFCRITGLASQKVIVWKRRSEGSGQSLHQMSMWNIFAASLQTTVLMPLLEDNIFSKKKVD